MTVPMASLRSPAAALVLFLVNAFVVARLFLVEYTREMGSIEAAYISISRYLTENWHDLTWFPLWYGGIPFQNTYPPLLHLMVAVTAEICGWSAGRAHHFVTALAYCLGPVTLFWMLLRLSGDRAASAFSALLYSLVSTSAFLIPVVAHDIGSVLHARRLQALLRYGEGPHVTSMTLLAVAIVCLDLAYERRRPVYYVLAAAVVSAVVLTNWLGGFAMGAAIISYLLARRATVGVWLVAMALGVYAYALASPWIPATTLLAVRTNAQRIGGPFTIGAQHLVYALVFLAGLAGLQRLLIRMKASSVLHFSALFFLFMGGVTLAAEYFGLFLLPQPQRYHLEMEMAVAPLAIFGLHGLLRSRSFLLRAAVAAVFLLFCGNQALKYRWYAKPMMTPIDITQTIEYKTARWFDINMRDRRVMAPGSSSFWMNAFTDTPQIGGGFDQGITNQNLPAAQFQIYSGMGTGDKEGEAALLWLKALGVHAVAIGGPTSREFFKPFRNGRKFEGLAQELWRDGDDRIYAVPQRSASLAHVMGQNQLVTRAPINGADTAPLQPYVAALDDNAYPLAQWRWRSRHSGTAKAKFSPGQILSVQIAYHPGWSAYAGARALPVNRDELGQIWVKPDCSGECSVEFAFTGGTEAALARVACWSACFGGLVWIVMSVRPRKTRIRPLNAYDGE
jgi:hypothetical protein